MKELLAFILAEVAKETPALVIDIVRLLAKADATEADWDSTAARWRKPWAQKTAEAEQRAAQTPPTAP